MILPTLAVTIARVQPGDSLRWVILRAFTPFAIIPYALAVTMLVAMSRGLRRAARTIAVSALAAVTSLLLLHVWWFVKPFLADAPGSATDDGFVVMTVNLHIGRADPDAVLDAVDRHGVDVLVLVEVTPSALAALDDGLGRRLEHRAGTPRLDRDGIMLFANESLHGYTEIGTSSPGFGVDMSTGSGSLRILAVHPIAPNNGVAQWSRDLDLVVETAQASRGPTVVAGDFNATLDHPHLQSLMDREYRDASADAGFGWRPTWPSSSGNVRFARMGLPPLFGLDHVFIRGPLEGTDAEVSGVQGTDHRALITRIAWTDSRDHSDG